MENDVITHIDSFPYYDNFDILIDGNKAYVLTSAGIYMIDAEALRKAVNMRNHIIFHIT